MIGFASLELSRTQNVSIFIRMRKDEGSSFPTGTISDDHTCDLLLEEVDVRLRKPALFEEGQKWQKHR